MRFSAITRCTSCMCIFCAKIEFQRHKVYLKPMIAQLPVAIRFDDVLAPYWKQLLEWCSGWVTIKVAGVQWLVMNGQLTAAKQYINPIAAPVVAAPVVAPVVVPVVAPVVFPVVFPVVVPVVAPVVVPVVVPVVAVTLTIPVLVPDNPVVRRLLRLFGISDPLEVVREIVSYLYIGPDAQLTDNLLTNAENGSILPRYVGEITIRGGCYNAQPDADDLRILAWFNCYTVCIKVPPAALAINAAAPPAGGAPAGGAPAGGAAAGSAAASSAAASSATASSAAAGGAAAPPASSAAAVNYVWVTASMDTFGDMVARFLSQSQVHSSQPQPPVLSIRCNDGGIKDIAWHTPVDMFTQISDLGLWLN